MDLICQKRINGSSMDLIGALPDNLIETILSKLPLRDAARTSILSTRWRYSWVKLPNVVLDYGFWEQLIPKTEDRRSGKVKFAKIISQILLLHQGSIIYFTLDIPLYRSSPEIDTLIGFVVRNGVKTFVLQMGLDEDYKLPSSLFNSSNLSSLELWGCRINFPSSFKGFNLLTSLTLVDVIISIEALQTVVSCSPLLAILQLRISIDILYIKFDAPNLQLFLYYYSSDTRYSFSPVNDVQKQTVCKLFDGLAFIRCLFLNSHCFESLVAGGVPMILPTPLLYLVSIELRKIRLEVEGLFSCVLCLIRSSPNLQKFKISVYHRKENYSTAIENLQGFEDNSHVAWNRLSEVTVEDIVGTRTEMELIKLFLAKSPTLMKLSIKLATDKADKIVKIMNELFQFQHASSKVKINIID